MLLHQLRKNRPRLLKLKLVREEKFKGMAFSSGGYGVRYGQALSSVLELNTLDVPEKTTVSANLNMAGLALSGAKRWTNSESPSKRFFSPTVIWTIAVPPM